MLTEVLSGDTAAAARAWDAPAFDLPAGTPASRRPAAALQDMDQESRLQAQEEGYRAGLAAARAEIDARKAELDRRILEFTAALDLLARPLAQLDAQVQEQLTQLALAIARQLLRRELKIDPTQVIAVVRETVGLLPAAARDVRVLLHPEDAALVRERLATPQVDAAWTLVEDPVLARGGCRVIAGATHIDARIETRLAGVIATLLGDERAGGRESAESGSEGGTA